MLGKLLKYELKSTARTFIPLYAAILVVAIVNGFTVGTEMFEIQGIATLILGGLMVALFVITIVVIIQRFKKNLLEDEGYLMFTLPVSPKMLVLSKYIVSLIWAILSGIVAVGAFLLVILISVRGEIGIDYFVQFFDEMHQILGTQGNWYIMLEVALLMLGGYSVFIFNIYLSLSMGQLSVFNKHRTAASFISFFVINIVISTIQSNFGTNIDLASDVIVNGDNILSILSNGLAIGLIFYLIMIVCLFIGTSFILEKKLNLE